MEKINIFTDAEKFFDEWIKDIGISWDGGKNFAQVTKVEKGKGFSIEDFGKEHIRICASDRIKSDENGSVSIVNIDIKIFADGNVRFVIGDSHMTLNVRKWFTFNKFAEKIKSENRFFKIEKKAA